MLGRRTLVLVLILQAACAAFLISDILASLFALPLPPFDWLYVELFQIGAALGLVFGIGLSAFALRQARERTVKAEAALARAQSAFRDVMDEKFVEWDLTPAEKDVALFAIKGFSTQEIASLRDVSDGTIKAQANAIYRKAGVSGRSQLLSIFIDDLVAEGVD